MASFACGEDEADYYRITDLAVARTAADSRSSNWAPEGLALEVSGMAFLPDDRLAVAIRKGEVWLLSGVSGQDPKAIRYQRFASALHEPLGLLHDGDSLLTVQRSELTRLRDTDGDDVADQYLTVAKGWGVTGHYHEYAYGPKRDGNGELWLTLNVGLGLKQDHLGRTIQDPVLGYRQGKWRGWGMKVDSLGRLVPVCAGMRSPSGLGRNALGDMFYTDQQGNWVAAGSVHHMRAGAFFHHPESLASMSLPGSTIQDVKEVPAGLPFPEAVARMQTLVPPAVWLPYKKMGQSATDILLDDSEGKFGPFAGQLLIGEFTQASINRVFLEKVGGQYQGACFPFRLGFASAVLRLVQGNDGAVYVGLTNRGWSSLGSASYGLQRLEWTGKTPFEIKEMRATRDGFELEFTEPVEVTSAQDVRSYSMASYTYLYHSSYGSDEIDTRSLAIRGADLLSDGRTVRLTVDGCRPLYVHELRAEGVRS
ncbi:MAG: hypothetical protein AAGA03_15180, partial [Planctomycetota bacterium]